MGKYGKRINIHTKVVIEEEGRKRILFFDFPKNGGADGVKNGYWQLITWFRVILPEITPWVMLDSIRKTERKISDTMMDFIMAKNWKTEVKK